ncbi:MAG: hypothetical protein ABIJ56_15785, partial [Pseudomonadota bacterium]
EGFLVLAEILVQELESDPLAEGHVLCLEDKAHAPLADELDDLITVGNFIAWLKPKKKSPLFKKQESPFTLINSKLILS